MLSKTVKKKKKKDSDFQSQLEKENEQIEISGMSVGSLQILPKVSGVVCLASLSNAIWKRLPSAAPPSSSLFLHVTSD